MFAGERDPRALLDTVIARLQLVLKLQNEDLARVSADQARELKKRIAAREHALREQLERDDPTPQVPIMNANLFMARNGTR